MRTYKTSLILISVLFVTLTSFVTAQVTSEKQENCGGCHSMTDSLKLNAELSSWGPAELQITVRVHNGGKEGLFVVAEPIRSDSSAGPYLHMSRKSPGGLLVVGFVLYEPSTKLLLYSDGAGAKLLRLAPGEDRVFDVKMSFPSNETIPPYELDGKAQDLSSPKKVQLQDLTGVRVEVGVLQASDQLTRLIDKKAGGRVMGLDQVSIGGHSHTLYDLQCVIGTDVSIRNTSAGNATLLGGWRTLPIISGVSMGALPFSRSERVGLLTCECYAKRGAQRTMLSRPMLATPQSRINGKERDTETGLPNS